MGATSTTPSRRFAVIDAPSNLGLRPPAEGTIPGCYKLAGALRDAGLVKRLAAEDAGCVTPPRYDRGDWKEGDGVFNAAGIATYTHRLADRLNDLLDGAAFPVVLGGDCSILLAAGLALRRRGRYGLAFLDGHSDFRHPGNSDRIGAAAGEDLALVTGRGQADLADLENRRPYFRDGDVSVVGIRDTDAARSELRDLGVGVWDASWIRSEGPEKAARAALDHLQRADLQGFWVHVDVDILDPEVMPAVDTPTPGGIGHEALATLVGTLAASPRCVGVEVAIFDPDLDPDGKLAHDLTDTLVRALHPARA